MSPTSPASRRHSSSISSNTPSGRHHPRPQRIPCASARRRSNRSTTSVLLAPHWAISQPATGSPNALANCAHSHSFSTEVDMSACRLPTRPIGSLKICVVGVAPCGLHHRPWCQVSAVFSCAPASEIRKLSSSLSLSPSMMASCFIEVPIARKPFFWCTLLII